MEETVRRAIAYAAAARVRGCFSSSIYSYERGAYSNMSETYDYDAGNHISGTKSGNLYLHGLGAHVSLQINDEKFSGFDHSSSSHFSGTVSGNTISLYDNGEGQYYRYSI